VVSRALLAGVVLALALAGCGDREQAEDADPPAAVPGGADPANVEVIEGWVTALARGEVEAAAEFFAIPSVIQNGTPPIRITTREQARAFNRSLPCGARLIRAIDAGRLTIATFRLTERPGPGTCGPGSGEDARTAFVIRDGEIAEWRRVPAGGGDGPAAPSSSA
jgi:hypothetical protein